MNRYDKTKLKDIEDIFQARTGVEFSGAHAGRRVFRRTAVIAAALVIACAAVFAGSRLMPARPVQSEEITRPFRDPKDPETPRACEHGGMDIRADMGDPVYCVLDGTVRETGYESRRGYYIIVDHADGLTSFYGTLSEILVEAEEAVSTGQKIGLAGNSGMSTGPHLHFEMLENGVAVDPQPYLYPEDEMTEQ